MTSLRQQSIKILERALTWCENGVLSFIAFRRTPALATIPVAISRK
jgi:hypothetical protein